MLTLINDRLTRKVFDDVMEVAWSTMWNVTDETPRNCKRFLDGHGMAYFLGCLNVSNCSVGVNVISNSKIFLQLAVLSRERRIAEKYDGITGKCC